MEATFKITDATGPAVLFAVTYKEPTQKKNGDPIDDLQSVEIYTEYEPFGAVKSIVWGASSPNGGGSMSTQNYINVQPGEKKTVKFWGVAVNTSGQESDKSDVQEIVVDRTEKDPMLAPMPPQ